MKKMEEKLNLKSVNKKTMVGKREMKEKRAISLFEISLLICMSFAIAFFMQESLVSAAESPEKKTNTLAPTASTGGWLSSLFGKGQAKPAAELYKDAVVKEGFALGKFKADSVPVESALGKALKDGSISPNDVLTRDYGNGDVAHYVSKTGDFYDKTGSGLPASQVRLDSNNAANFQNVYGTERGFLFFKTTNFVGGHLLEGLGWAGMAAGAIQLIGGFAGLDKKQTNAATIAAVAGIMTYKGIVAFTGGDKVIGALGGISSKGFGAIAGIGVAAAVFILLYKKESQKVVTFQCLPFEPPLGGAKCEACNSDPFRPCSEYRCRSLGQACQLLNAGTGQEQCAWINPKDVNSPTITPWVDALNPRGLKYITDTSIRPPALGVKIVNENNGCLPAFTPLEFGIITNEPAQCKIDFNHTAKFDDMLYYFGESNYYSYNHTQKMRLPGPDSIGGEGSPLLRNDGTYALYVRCRDGNGNENVDEYAVSYCVDKGPDTTPPIIQESSIPSGAFVQFNADSVPIEIYVNEPSECKWSKQDKAYEDMENSMECFDNNLQINSDLLFTCSGDLKGVSNGQDNKFYFRCKDQPGKAESDRNVNSQSFPLTLKGSKAILNIIDISPNGTLFGATSSIDINLEVETSNGAEEGKAVCYFSNSENLDSYIMMFETNSFKHKQQLSLGAGSYTYYIRCIDAGGNLAEDKTSFNIVIDKSAPIVTRIYREGVDALKLTTNEDAECAYSLNSCNFVFDEGIKFVYNPPSNRKVSFAEWKPSVVYYIKCKDDYGNEPAANSCSIIASAIELNKKQ